MNKPLTISIAITLLLAGTAFFIYRQSHRKNIISSTLPKRVAIFYPATHPAMLEIQQGIETTIKHEGEQRYEFKTFNANGNNTLLRSMAEEIVAGNYDIAITIGALCTKTLYEIALKKHLTMPIVFTAVENPASIGIDQAQYPITGVTAVPDLAGQLDALLKLKPTVKKIMLVYNPSGSSDLAQRKNQLEKIAVARNVAFGAIEIYKSNEIYEKLSGQLADDIDVVLILTDHTTVAGLDALVKLCNQRGIILYASDLNSADRGAALAFGVTEFMHGETAAYKALQIIDKKKSAQKIPITSLAHASVLKINDKAMELQGRRVTSSIARQKNHHTSARK